MRKTLVLIAVAVAVCANAVDAPGAALAAPVLRLTSSIPDYVTPGNDIVLFVDVQNVGDESASGDVTVRYTFPAGVTVRDPDQVRPGFPESPACTQNAPEDECVLDATGLPPGGQLRFKTVTSVEPGASGPLAGAVEVSGGGASEAVTEPFSLRAEPAGPFALKGFAVGLTNGPGAQATQAGATPAEQSTDLSFIAEARENFNVPFPFLAVTALSETYRDVVVHVPAGFVGDPTAVARCKPSQLITTVPGTVIPACPLASQIGVIELFSGGDIVPLYNIEPPTGTPAEFGFSYQSVVVTLVAKVRPSDDGIDIVTAKIANSVPISKFRVSLWGAPGDRSHDPLRGHCLQPGFGNNGESCVLGEGERSTKPFLRMPTSCTSEPLHWGVEVDTYQHVGNWVPGSTTSPAVEGCENVPFSPGFSFAPSVLAAHAASGADATVSMPQDTLPNNVAEADVKSTTVSLPAGVSLNPSAANGLQACTDVQLRLGLEGASECPGASKVGSVTLKTPLLDHEIGGSIFIRSQNSSDPASGELFRVAIEIRSDQDGVDVKLPGQVKIDPSTGQITTVFENLPQLPFEAIALHFEGGSHPVLVTPSDCGSYTTGVNTAGWNDKTVKRTSQFTLDEGCAARGFTPSFMAGTTNPVAGAFSPFTLQLTRTDSDQELASLSSLTLPKGLLADIGSVPRCSDAQVAAAACPESSRLGNVTVGAGTGATPVYIDTGNAYLTGPYKGAPFGIAFLIHAQAGPFDLGMVVVRAALNIDPHTAQPIIQTDPLPTILKGVPVRLRDLRVNIDRPHFMLNPTNCQTMAVTGTAKSTQGTSASLSSRFQVGECRSLGFKPKFSASTSSKVSRTDGASLTVRIAYPKGAQANIRSVKVKLPKQLASRLPTLQQACTDATFAANPAACPAASRVGTATAVSPILASPLTGPAYFVSHGGAKFPELILVLQGEGVTIELNGETFIAEKTGITSSTFRTIPDAPVSSFQLSLPRGPHSALGSKSDLCKGKLVMPTRIVAQNGAVIKQATRIKVSGCAEHAVKRHARAHRKRRK